jgi:hypothetical protein
MAGAMMNSSRRCWYEAFYSQLPSQKGQEEGGCWEEAKGDAENDQELHGIDHPLVLFGAYSHGSDPIEVAPPIDELCCPLVA